MTSKSITLSQGLGMSLYIVQCVDLLLGCSVPHSKYVHVLHVQWNLSNPDSLGTEESVLISEVS